MAINVDLSQVLSKGYDTPTIIPNILLIEPGKWNDLNYTKEEIDKAFKNTDWSNKDNYSLILDHADNPNEAVRNWSGYVKNFKLKEDGKLYGDLEIWNPLVALYLTEAKAKFGISAKLNGQDSKGKLKDFTFENFSVVTKPAVKTAYINLSQIKQKGGNNNMIEVQTLSEVAPVEEPVEEKPVKDKKPEETEEEMSETEILEYTINSDWTDFVKKMRESNPKISFKDIAKAYKSKTNSNKDLENLSDTELLEKFNVISAALKKREKLPVYSDEKENKSKPKPEEQVPKAEEMASEADKKAEEDKKADEIKKKSDKQKEELDTLNSKVVEKDNKIKALQAEVEKLGMPDSKTISLSASGTKQISGDAYENMAKFLVDNSGMGGDRRIF
jgi:hypothetical protein